MRSDNRIADRNRRARTSQKPPDSLGGGKVIQGWKVEVSLESKSLERCAMGAGCTAAARQARRKGGTQNQAIGRSRGGLTTKIVALVDALGNLTRFVLLPGQRHDSIGVTPLITGIDFDALLADKAFDNDWIRAELDQRGALAVIPPKADRVRRIDCDFAMYKWRHLVENFFCNLKEFRCVATRYDKTDTSFAATIHLVAAYLAIR